MNNHSTLPNPLLANAPLELLEGHLADPSLWTPLVARNLAQSEGIDLNPLHWQVLCWLRRVYEEQGLPPQKEILSQWFAEQFDLTRREASQRLASLFPGNPLPQAARIAGLPLGFLSNR